MSAFRLLNSSFLLLTFHPVLVVAAPPNARLVAAFGRAIEPLVHSPATVQSARISRIGVVNDAVLERERAHPRPRVYDGVHVVPAAGRAIADPDGAPAG